VFGCLGGLLGDPGQAGLRIVNNIVLGQEFIKEGEAVDVAVRKSFDVRDGPAVLGSEGNVSAVQCRPGWSARTSVVVSKVYCSIPPARFT